MEANTVTQKQKMSRIHQPTIYQPNYLKDEKMTNMGRNKQYEPRKKKS